MSLRNRIVISVISICFTLFLTPARADNFLRVYATISGTADTVGMAEHFAVFGVKTPVFIPPYTLHFYITPLPDSTYQARIDFYELGPAFKDYHFEKELVMEGWQTVENLESKGLKFDYHFVIFSDTVNYFNYLPKDSLTNFESIHFRSWIWRSSYADYKWEMRKGLLENTYNFYRKEHKVMRSGKIDFHVYPSSYNTPFINNLTGVGYDFTGNSMFAAFGDNFDSALPQHTQLYIIYETWGYSARSLAAGYSRYLLDDNYRARSTIENMTVTDIKSVLMDEYPSDRDKADIICGAFVKYLVDSYGVPQLKKLYKNSKPSSFAFETAYGKNFDDMITAFIEYENNLRLSESDAYYLASLFSSQMWFDRAMEYNIWLGSQPVRRDFHLKNLGAAFFHNGNYEESQKSYAVYLERNPEEAEARYLIAMSILRLGRIKQALRYFEEVADSFENAAKMLAEIYLDKNELQKAEKYLSKISEYPDSWTSLLKARLAYAKNETGIAGSIVKKALSQSNAIITAAPGEARGYIYAAYAFMLDGRYEESQSELEVALFVENRPYYRGSIFLALGRLADIQGRRQLATENYQKAIETNSGEYIHLLAEQYMDKPFRLK